MTTAVAPGAVRFEEVSRHFGRLRAVDRVSFEVRDGEFFTLLGPSGSGKTTCLRLVAGFERPDSGTVFLSGRAANRLAPFERDVHTVFQDYALFPHMSVLDNVAYGLMVRGVARAERRRQAQEALAMVRLDQHGRRRPTELSGGQRQRVALARALVGRPRVLLLDEPLGALDLKLRQEMQLELKALQEQVGITFLYVTHDQEEALSMSDRIAIFREGRIEQLGEPTELYERPRTTFVAGFVGISNLVEGALAERLAGRRGTFVVRPEKVRVLAPDEAPAPGEVSVAGVIQAVSYLGAARRLEVALPGGERFRVSAAAEPPVAARAGEAVLLAWRAAEMHRLEEA